MNCNWQNQMLSSSYSKICFVKQIGTFIKRKYNQKSFFSGFIFSLNAIL